MFLYFLFPALVADKRFHFTTDVSKTNQTALYAASSNLMAVT
jgi:hypothetical protein